jgi:hypothetical protein
MRKSPLVEGDQARSGLNRYIAEGFHMRFLLIDDGVKYKAEYGDEERNQSESKRYERS